MAQWISDLDSLPRKINNTTGHGGYVDSKTDVNPQVFLNGVAQNLTNDANLSFERLPDGVTSYWDNVNNKITPDSEGSELAIQIDFQADATTQDKTMSVRVFTPNGFGPGVPRVLHERTIRLTRDSATPPEPVGFLFSTPVGAPELADGIFIEMTANGTDVDVYQSVVFVTKVGDVIK